MDKLKTYPFLADSKKDDGVYCVPCRLFPTQGNDRGRKPEQLVNKPFNNWKKFYDRIKLHTSDSNRSHFHCVVSPHITNFTKTISMSRHSYITASILPQ